MSNVNPNLMTSAIVLMFYGVAILLAALTTSVALGQSLTAGSWRPWIAAFALLIVLTGWGVYDANAAHDGFCDKLFGGRRPCSVEGKIRGRLAFEVPLLAVSISLPGLALTGCVRFAFAMVAQRRRRLDAAATVKTTS
jgi:hypothetical protein